MTTRVEYGRLLVVISTMCIGCACQKSSETGGRQNTSESKTVKVPGEKGSSHDLHLHLQEGFGGSKTGAVEIWIDEKLRFSGFVLTQASIGLAGTATYSVPDRLVDIKIVVRASDGSVRAASTKKVHPKKGKYLGVTFLGKQLRFVQQSKMFLYD